MASATLATHQSSYRLHFRTDGGSGHRGTMGPDGAYPGERSSLLAGGSSFRLIDPGGAVCWCLRQCTPYFTGGVSEWPVPFFHSSPVGERTQRPASGRPSGRPATERHDDDAQWQAVYLGGQTST